MKAPTAEELTLTYRDIVDLIGTCTARKHELYPAWLGFEGVACTVCGKTRNIPVRSVGEIHRCPCGRCDHTTSSSQRGVYAKPDYGPSATLIRNASREGYLERERVMREAQASGTMNR